MPKANYKLDRARKDRYLKKISEGVGRTKAAYAVGVAPSTIEREIAKGNGFADERRDAELIRDDKVENSLYKAAMRGDVAAIKEWLRVHKREEYGPQKSELPAAGVHIEKVVIPGAIDWDAIPWELAEKFMAIHEEILALQPASGGLVINEDGSEAE